MRRRQGRPAALFRMLGPSEDGGVSYYEFVLERLPGGRIRATDIYVYSTAEFFSETLRRLLLPVVVKQSPTFLGWLLTGERDRTRDLDQLGRASVLMSQGKPEEALAIIRSLPPQTRKQKAVLLACLRAAQQSGDDKECAAVAEELHKQFPDNPYLEMIAIDESAVKKDYPAAMKVLDRLDQSLGGDPYLDVMRATYCEARNDFEGARRFARRAVEREPSLIEGYWALVACSLKAKDYEETLARLREIDQNFGAEFQDLDQVPEYAGFVKSPAYAKWLEYLRAKNPAQHPSPAK
jgi:tetratricopeptide (TPR) repeat protein